jgi:hypothetical protein
VRFPAGAAAAIVLLLAAPAALAHQGNPHYRSTVTSVTPAVKGLTVTVLNYDDRLELRNFSGRDVVIDDYENKPYARVLADRTVQVNTNSQAYYLNDDRYANVQVPKGLGSRPSWKLVDRSGRFQWHDHRMHYMSPTVPPQVTDQTKKTRVFDWRVPLTIGGTKGNIAGTLDWVPLPSTSLPVGLIWGSAIALIGLLIGVFLIRRRRAHPAGEEGGTQGRASEAW